MLHRPNKKTDRELYILLKQTIKLGNYVFLKHAKQRQVERYISDLVVLNILEGKEGYNRKRNKLKDQFKNGNQDWNYCIEGIDVDAKKIRIIVSFVDELMLIITVIRLDLGEQL